MRRLRSTRQAVKRTAVVAPIIAILVLASVATALAQRRGGFGGGGGGRFSQIPIAPNTPYDGRFTFVRVRYGPDYGFVSQRLPWSHDYPAGEQHFMKIVDDFRYQHWGNFESQIMRVLPEARIFDMDLANPIFHSFFEIRTLDVPQYYDPPPAIFRAIYEDNDPAKRILVMINYNTDISEFWEWSDTGLKPIDESNEAYKLGVNYVIYGMTH